MDAVRKLSRVLCLAQVSSAPIEFRATAGATRVFLDESAALTPGGGLRFGITEGFGLDPEVLYSRDDRFRHWIVDSAPVLRFVR